MRDWLNEIMLDISETAWANGIVPADYQRQLSESIAKHVGKAREERDMLMYWLLRAYESGRREGWEDGPSIDATMNNLCSVLANMGLDPNLAPKTKEILNGKPLFYIE